MGVTLEKNQSVNFFPIRGAEQKPGLTLEELCGSDEGGTVRSPPASPGQGQGDDLPSSLTP